jgi:hypothetical protein
MATKDFTSSQDEDVGCGVGFFAMVRNIHKL